MAGAIAFLIGLITLNLRSDYLAIATIGIAEIISQILKNEGWLTNGVRGITRIPRPFRGWIPGQDTLLYLGLVLLVLAGVYWLSERAYRSPWGRVLRAIREDEPAALAAGKDVLQFRLQAFVLGSMLMGLAGALYAHFVNFISPEAFQPEFATFIVWVMLIAGGSGNNRGALLGALAIWGCGRPVNCSPIVCRPSGPRGPAPCAFCSSGSSCRLFSSLVHRVCCRNVRPSRLGMPLLCPGRAEPLRESQQDRMGSAAPSPIPPYDDVASRKHSFL